MDDSAETGLALDDGVRDTHLLAEGRKEDDELNGVNIVGDEDKRSLLVLDQTNNVVETVLGSVGLLGDILLLLALLDGGGLLEETLLLLGLGLRAILVEELESLGGGVLVENVLELGESRGNLQAHLKDLLLALEADVLGPLDHTAHVTLGLDVLTDAEVTGALLDQRVLQARRIRFGFGYDTLGRISTDLGSLLRASLSLRERGRGDLLAGFGGLSLRKEDISDLLQAKKSSLNSSESYTALPYHQGISALDGRKAVRISSQVFTMRRRYRSSQGRIESLLAEGGTSPPTGLRPKTNHPSAEELDDHQLRTSRKSNHSTVAIRVQR